MGNFIGKDFFKFSSIFNIYIYRSMGPFNISSKNGHSLFMTHLYKVFKGLLSYLSWLMYWCYGVWGLGGFAGLGDWEGLSDWGG